MWYLKLISVSGYIKVYFAYIKDTPLDSYIGRFLSELRKYAKYRGYKCGSHVFRGGVLNIFQMPQREDDKVSIVWGFEKVEDFRFLDALFFTAMKFGDTCILSCSIKGDVDFQRLREWVKTYCLKWLGEDKGTFSAILDVGGQILWLTAYHEEKIFNIKGKFQLDGLKPSDVLNILSKGESLKMLTVRVPRSLKHSYTLMAKRMRIDVSRLIREALKKYLIELYSKDIEEVSKLSYE